MWVDKFQNNFVYLVWAADTGSASQALPLKCCEVRGGFAIDPRSARTAVNVGVGEKIMRQSPAKASPALDCSAAALPWPASQRSHFEGRVNECASWNKQQSQGRISSLHTQGL